MSTNKMTLIKIGEHIAELRKKNGYTQKSLSEKLFVGEKTISKWERGVVAPDIDIIKSMSKLFNVSVEEIINGESIEDNQDDDKSVTVDAIKLYTNQSKRKYLKVLCTVVVLLLFVFTTIFVVDRQYRWEIKRFNVKDEISFSGYYFKNSIETKFVISNIFYDGEYVGTIDEEKTNEVIVYLSSNGEELYSKHAFYENAVPLSKALQDFSFVFESKSNIDFSNLTLHVDYYQMDKIIRKEFKIEGK